MVHFGGGQARFPAIEECDGRRCEEPLVEVAHVEIGSDCLNVDGDTADCVSGVDEDLVHALFSANLNELADRNENRRH